MRQVCTLKWQSDSSSSKHWYCPHLELRTDSWSGTDPETQLKLAAALIKANPMGSDPVAFCTRLDEMGIARRVYDCRTSEYMPLDRVLPATWHKYLARKSNGNCMVSCMAESEAEAVRELTKKLAKAIANPNYESLSDATHNFQDWIARGSFAEQTRDKAPEMPDIATLFTPLGKPDEIITEAEAVA